MQKNKLAYIVICFINYLGGKKKQLRKCINVLKSMNFV